MYYVIISVILKVHKKAVAYDIQSTCTIVRMTNNGCINIQDPNYNLLIMS